MTISWNKEMVKHKQQYFILGAAAFLGFVFLAIGSNLDADNTEMVSLAVSEKADMAATSQIADVVALEYRLTHTLSQIQGVGDVTVQITVKNSGRKEYAVNTQHTSRSTSEENADSNLQTTESQEQYTIVQQNRNGIQEALLVEEIAPEIIGVLVVADGASDAVVQERLLHAVAGLLQIPLCQIVVVPGEGAI